MLNAWIPCIELFPAAHPLPDFGGTLARKAEGFNFGGTKVLDAPASSVEVEVGQSQGIGVTDLGTGPPRCPTWGLLQTSALGPRGAPPGDSSRPWHWAPVMVWGHFGQFGHFWALWAIWALLGPPPDLGAPRGRPPGDSSRPRHWAPVAAHLGAPPDLGTGPPWPPTWGLLQTLALPAVPHLGLLQTLALGPRGSPPGTPPDLGTPPRPPAWGARSRALASRALRR